MKKASILGFIACFMILVISGCGSKDTRDFNIENHGWVFSNMVSGENGEIVACGETVSEQYSDVPIIAMTCSAADGILSVGTADGERLDFSYQMTGKDTNSLIYELVYRKGDEEVKGMAVSSMTEYAKGKYEYTLVVDIDGFAVYFYDREDET